MDILFLDLEETLIDDWSTGVLLTKNITAIQDFIHSFPCNPVIGLMSWAVWDERDKLTFNKKFRPVIEDALGWKFDDRFLWSMDDWCNQLFKASGKDISRDDLFDIFGKEEVLFMMSRRHKNFKGASVALIDDAVEHNLKWHSKTNDCSVIIKRIDLL